MLQDLCLTSRDIGLPEAGGELVEPVGNGFCLWQRDKTLLQRGSDQRQPLRQAGCQPDMTPHPTNGVRWGGGDCVHHLRGGDHITGLIDDVQTQARQLCRQLIDHVQKLHHPHRVVRAGGCPSGVPGGTHELLPHLPKPRQFVHAFDSASPHRQNPFQQRLSRPEIDHGLITVETRQIGRSEVKRTGVDGGLDEALLGPGTARLWIPQPRCYDFAQG